MTPPTPDPMLRATPSKARMVPAAESSAPEVPAAEVARVLPDPNGGCVCSFYSEDRGGGYSELVQEYEPACPVHSDHLYDPRTGVWILRTALLGPDVVWQGDGVRAVASGVVAVDDGEEDE